MGATVMNGSVIGKNCLIAAGSLVLEHQNIPDGSMVMGRPAEGHAGIDGRRNCRVKRECTFFISKRERNSGKKDIACKKRYTSG